MRCEFYLSKIGQKPKITVITPETKVNFSLFAISATKATTSKMKTSEDTTSKEISSVLTENTLGTQDKTKTWC